MDKNKLKKAFKTAFPYTVPIMAGYFFFGLTYGIYAKASGFSLLYPILLSVIIYAGSMEFLTITLLLSKFNPVQAFLLTLVINARHIFYGIAMLHKYKNLGLKKSYIIFGLCDETFSINYSAKIPEDVDKGYFIFFVTMLNHLYWVVSSIIGSLICNFIFFNTKGIEFVLTSMFVIIFIEQWLKDKDHTSSILGLIVSIFCLIIFGKNNFIIPSMLLIFTILTIFRKPLERRVLWLSQNSL